MEPVRVVRLMLSIHSPVGYGQGGCPSGTIFPVTIALQSYCELNYLKAVMMKLNEKTQFKWHCVDEVCELFNLKKA